MPHELIEGAVDRLVTYYRANMATKLAALNSEYADGIVLRAPQTDAYHVGMLQISGDNIDYPKVFVLGRETEITFYNQESTDATHTLEVMAAVKGTDTEVIQRSVYRFMRALWELTMAWYFSQPAHEYAELHPTPIAFDDPPSLETTPPWIGRGTLTLTLTKQETYA